MSVEQGGGSAEDQRLAAALRDAGEHVFAYLYETFGTPLYDYCEGLLQDSIAAADAVQDSLVAIDKRVTSLPEPGPLRVALYGEARRLCLEQLPRHWGRQTTQPENPVDEFAWDIPEIDTPNAAGGKQAVVVAALARLPDRDREGLSLSFRHELNGADLAAVLGLTTRRAQRLLADASRRFETSAAVVAALRAGPAACAVLAGLIGQEDPASVPAVSKLGQRLAAHVGSCADCALSRADREFPAALISEVPLATPPVRLRLRINRTALALGEYRNTVVKRDGGTDDGGLRLVQARSRRTPRVVVATTAALAVVAVPVAVYRIEAAQAARPHPVASQSSPEPAASPIDISTLHISPELHPPAPRLKRTPRRRRHHAPVSGKVTPSPSRRVPSSGTTGPSAPGQPAPGPARSHSPSPNPSPQPTTPQPSPSPTGAPSPTPTLPLVQPAGPGA